MDYLAIMRRRKWIILVPPILAALAAYVLSSGQSPLYRARATVLVNTSGVVNSVSGLQNPGALSDPTRFLTTEASIARSPELARRVVAAAGVPGESPGKFLSQSNASPEANADVLDILVVNRHASYARRLANTYATQFTLFKSELDTAAINAALQSIVAQERALRARGLTASVEYANLISQQAQFATLGKLLANNASVLQPADFASKTRPRPARDGILGALLGGVLGLALGFLAEALDRRVRSEQEVEEALELPVLARVAQPPRKLRKSNELLMLADPASVHAETFRKLRTSIEFANLEKGARTIMVTSAVQREGKSTTIANLAIAFARAGRRVALVDLDLRRPFLNRFFRVGTGPGITDVVVNRVGLEEALRPIALTPAASLYPSQSANGRRRLGATEAANGRREVEGVLQFLPSGTIPPSAGEFLQNEGIGTVLDTLGAQFDVVLVDTPPLLAFGDATTLSDKVDALFVVVRLTMVQRPLIHELGRQLHNCRATPLGFVLTAVERGESYRYIYEAYGYEVRPQAESEQRRVR